ncbi:MAG: glycosyltransferase family 39 protein, partial [Candidatus Zixiibacteriota bacterium]
MRSKANRFIRENSGLLLIIGLALIIRLWYLIIYQGMPVWDQLTVDNYYHHNWALDLAAGNIFGDTTYFRAPFYVYCLGLLYALLGSSLWIGRLFGLAIGVGSIVMTYRIGKKVFDHKTGLIAAAIHSLYPVLIYFESELLLDPLFTLLLQWAVWRTLIWWDSRKTSDIFVAGLVVGLTAITRPTALILLPLVALIVLTTVVRFRAAISRLAVLTLGTALVVLPITVRNIILAGDPVLIASQGGINLYLGNNHAADGVSAIMPEPMGFNWRINQVTHLAERELGRSLKPGEVSSFWLDKSVDWILSNPDKFLGLYMKKLYWNFSDREVSNNRNLGVFFHRIGLLRLNPLSFGILFALTVTGTLICYPFNRKGAFLFALVMSYSVVSAVFFFSSRFRLPLLPFYIILSSGALCWFTAKIIENVRKAIWPLGVAVIAGLFSFYPIVRLPAGDPSQHLISEGLYFMSVEDYRQALDSFFAARKIDPAFPETHLNIGAAYLRLGQLDSAEYYFTEEIRLNPDRAKANINLASVNLLRGDLSEAIHEANLAVRLRPYDPIANMALIRTLFADSQLADGALSDSIAVAAVRTHYNIYLLNDVGAHLAAAGNLDRAGEILEWAVASRPPPVETDDFAFERKFVNSKANWKKEKAEAFYQLGYING